ncbi:MAG: type I DNA topoisomerase [Clostridiales bacterium]|nr:type I DNA topoisomerase [Clostridiales bacterium]
MDLIIVESPSKAKTISKYLKGKYRVDASGGHIRDLPQKTLGVSVSKNYEPRYVVSPGKEETIDRLIDEAKRADRIYLATDPDREGEAISWHLQTVLGMDKEGENRIEFNEISPKAVERALKNPRKINYNLVDAQQARRVLDRLVGYKLSPLLNNKLQSGLSAGRVQSVALRLVVEREREIQAFVPEEYWTITAEVQDKKNKFSPFKAILDKHEGKKLRVANKEEADAAVSALQAGEYVVKSIKKVVTKSHAPAPFTTSTLQQDASNKYGMTAPETMLMAQHLYEGIDIEGEGHRAFVTYIRTDSTRVSEDAQHAALEYIAGRFGKDYCPEEPNIYISKKGAQDAHEAIRPIDVTLTPERAKKMLDKKHFNVYKLIYERFIASQMAEAQYDSMQIEIENGDYGLRANGKTLKFAGYTAIYQETKKEDDEEGNGKLLPALEEGDPLNEKSLKAEQKFTKPPVRYTDASLVKAMEDKGIGRPSTYASIISVLNKRKYVEKDGKYMLPTEIAYRITDMLVKYFTDIMDVGFTASMEEKLDDIEDGGTDWHALIADFYPPFEEKLKFANGDGDELTDILCEKCGKPMIRKTGRYGTYLACSGYPACSNIVSEGEAEISDTACPKCGTPMVVKSGRYGKFLACPNYPDCKATMPYGVKKDEVFVGTCPDCGKPAKQLRTKSGKIYYGCSGYPACKFMSWDIPTGEKCPDCGSPVIQTAKGVVKCSNRECSYKSPIQPQPAPENGEARD